VHGILHGRARGGHHTRQQQCAHQQPGVGSPPHECARRVERRHAATQTADIGDQQHEREDTHGKNQRGHMPSDYRNRHLESDSFIVFCIGTNIVFCIGTKPRSL
jgi:hypothetical protein